MGGCRRRGFGFRRRRCGGGRIGGGIFGGRPGFNIGGIFGHRPAGVNIAACQTVVQPAQTQTITVQPVPPVVQLAPVPVQPVPVQSAAVVQIQKTIAILEVKLQKFEMQLASLKILLIKLEVIFKFTRRRNFVKFLEISISSGVNQSDSISKYNKYC